MSSDGTGGLETTATATAGYRHTVQFYQHEAYLIDVVASYVAGGLERDEALLLIITAAHWEALASRLAGDGIDVARARASGRLVMLDAAATLARLCDGERTDPRRLEEVLGAAIDRARAGASVRGVRVFGEMVDLLWRDGLRDAALALEDQWNDLARAHVFSLLCAYPLARFDESADALPFARVCAAHHDVVPTEDWTRRGSDEARQREMAELQQRALALSTEIERRKQVESELERARAEAVSANRAKDEFLALLGHELRNPLAPIVTALQLMELRGDKTAPRELQIIERQVRNLVRLVDDLLDVSRISRGKLDLRLARFDLRDALAKAVEIASPALDQRRHRLTLDVPRAPVHVDGDEARLAQVFANLLTNAAKYTPAGGHVALAVRVEGDDAVVEVSDDGLGISPDLLPRVFDLFVQGEPAGDRAGGLGIGLSLVRNLVQLHGGTVEARSDGAGRGSSFVVRLPASIDAAAVARPAWPAPRLVARGTPRRVLVVDDNGDALELVAEVLRAIGHEVQTAADAREAMRLVRAFAPDVAILDIGLPEIDGYELAARIRAELGPYAPRLVALTGYGQERDHERSTAAGFEAHLVKPVDAGALIDVLERGEAAAG